MTSCETNLFLYMLYCCCSEQRFKTICSLWQKIFKSIKFKCDVEYKKYFIEYQTPITITDAHWSLFHWNLKLLGLGRQFGQINFVAFGVFWADLSAPILVLSLIHVFHQSTNISTKKLSLYIHMPNIYLTVNIIF